MANEKIYTSTIRDFPLMFFEMKRTAMLLMEGKTAEDILLLSVEQNVYQLEKEKRRRSMPLKMTKRLSTIGKPLLNTIINGTIEEAKLIVFLALMKSERLVYEYMVEIYTDKQNFDEITDVDFTHFIDRKTSNDKTVASWNGDTIRSLNSKIKQILCDAGLAKKIETGITVQKPIVDKNFCSLLDESDLKYARILLGEELRV